MIGWLGYVFIFIAIVFIYTTINTMRKIERLETIIEEQDEYFLIKTKIANAITEMREIDSRGGFESDDEVGGVFNTLKDVVEELGEDNEA